MPAVAEGTAAVFTGITMGAAGPAVRPAMASAAGAAAEPASAQAREGLGDGFGGIVRFGRHEDSFYMRLDMDLWCMSHYIYMTCDNHMHTDI
jgi:hypothetical protein